MGNQPIAMGKHFETTANRKARRGANHRDSCIFQHLYCHLKACKEAINAVPIICLNKGAEGVQINTRREMLRIIMHNDPAARVICCLSHNLHRQIC